MRVTLDIRKRLAADRVQHFGHVRRYRSLLPGEHQVCLDASAGVERHDQLSQCSDEPSLGELGMTQSEDCRAQLLGPRGRQLGDLRQRLRQTRGDLQFVLCTLKRRRGSQSNGKERLLRVIV